MRSASSRATRSRMSSVTSTISRSAPRPERSTARRLLVAFGVGNVGALVHRELGRDGELAAERADDQESHGLAP